MSDVGRVLVCMPTYNEIESLPVTAANLRATVPSVDLLVIDDGSPDGTGAFADTLAADDPAVHVLHRKEKAGLGAAYTAGFEWALARGYDVVVEMDADGSHPASALPTMLDALANGADLALGSRWVPGGAVVNWPKSRQVLSRGGNTYVRLALGLPLGDATGGFRAYRAEVLKALPLADGVQSHGYCFQVDLAWQTWLRGFTIVEVPITFTERIAGESKMSGSIVREALLKVTSWAWTSRRAKPGTARAARITSRQP